MASVITDNLRHQLLELLQSSIDDNTTNYYIGFSKLDSSSSSLDLASLHNQRRVRTTLQSVKRLTNSSFVVPLVEWTTGDYYDAYDDVDPNQTNFYVYNSSTREVFVCVEKGINEFGVAIQSTVAPTSPGDGQTFETADGYKWRYLYQLSNIAYANFKSRDYIPVKTALLGSFIDEEQEQYSLQTASVNGEILSIAIDNPGTTVSDGSTITISGDGDSASFVPTIVDGSIVRITVDSDGSGNYTHGSGYYNATATVSSGDAVIRPVIGPIGGINADPHITLKAKALMIQVDVQDDEEGVLITQNEFDQIVLMKDLKVYGSDSDFIGNAGNVLKSFTTSSLAVSLFENEIFEGDVSGSFAKVFYQDLANNRLYYYQDTETGYGAFSINEFVTGQTSGEVAQVLGLNNPDVDPYSGEILYINNITAVPREADQTEDTRIIIQLG